MNQEFALSILKSGQNVFLTGSAGTGKTYILNEYISYLRLRKVGVAVTASTGIAATHIGGMTIHSFSGIGIKEKLNYADLSRLNTKKYLKKNIENTDVLIIDEISMLHKNQLEMVNQVFQYIRNTAKPFGGIQIILTGDFFQLPPISKKEESNREKFAFMSQAWLDANLTICYLTEQFRQSRDPLWYILEQIRSQSIEDESVYALLETQKDNDFESSTKLYTHNIDVNETNQKQLDLLEGEVHEYAAKSKGNTKLVEMLERSVMAKVVLKLKLDTEVMFVRNNPEKSYVNGTQGIVIGFEEDDDFPIVRTKDGDEITVYPEKWTIDDETGKPLASFEQIPLRLAWAITIHKSQGMTLDTAEIDLSGAFEKGQGYVALSRLKSIDGLKLKGINRVALLVDDLAFKADQRFMELSVEAEDKNTDDELLELNKAFLERIGAITDEKQLEKRRKKLKSKGEKKNTYELTLDGVKGGKTIKEIAEERGIHERTIIKHFQVLKNKYPTADFNLYKPDSKTIIKVKESIDNIRFTGKPVNFTEDGTLKLSAIFNMLDGKIPYDQIQLAMLFI